MLALATGFRCASDGVGGFRALTFYYGGLAVAAATRNFSLSLWLLRGQLTFHDLFITVCDDSPWGPMAGTLELDPVGR